MATWKEHPQKIDSRQPPCEPTPAKSATSLASEIYPRFASERIDEIDKSKQPGPLGSFAVPPFPPPSPATPPSPTTLGARPRHRIASKTFPGLLCCRPRRTLVAISSPSGQSCAADRLLCAVASMLPTFSSQPSSKVDNCRCQTLRYWPPYIAVVMVRLFTRNRP